MLNACSCPHCDMFDCIYVQEAEVCPDLVSAIIGIMEEHHVSLSRYLCLVKPSCLLLAAHDWSSKLPYPRAPQEGYGGAMKSQRKSMRARSVGDNEHALTSDDLKSKSMSAWSVNSFFRGCSTCSCRSKSMDAWSFFGIFELVCSACYSKSMSAWSVGSFECIYSAYYFKGKNGMVCRQFWMYLRCLLLQIRDKSSEVLAFCCWPSTEVRVQYRKQ